MSEDKTYSLDAGAGWVIELDPDRGTLRELSVFAGPNGIRIRNMFCWRDARECRDGGEIGRCNAL